MSSRFYVAPAWKRDEPRLMSRPYFRTEYILLSRYSLTDVKIPSSADSDRSGNRLGTVRRILPTEIALGEPIAERANP
jgi:hypothetical protein